MDQRLAIPVNQFHPLHARARHQRQPIVADRKAVAPDGAVEGGVEAVDVPAALEQPAIHAVAQPVSVGDRHIEAAPRFEDAGEVRDDLRPGLRAFSADKYVILYYVYDRGIEIAAVVHGARDLKGLLRRGEL